MIVYTDYPTEPIPAAPIRGRLNALRSCVAHDLRVAYPDEDDGAAARCRVCGEPVAVGRKASRAEHAAAVRQAEARERADLYGSYP